MFTEQNLRGVIVPIVTPFDYSGHLDLLSFEEMVSRLVDKGIRGVVVNGTPAESPFVEIGELELLVKSARSALGSVPLIVNTGSSSSAEDAVNQIVWAKSLGVDAVLAAPPVDGLHSQLAIIEHYDALSQARLPVILDDRYRSSHASLTLETIQAIMERPHMVGMNERTADYKRNFKLARTMKKPVLCGDDELFFASLCCGAKGGIVTSANLDSDQFVTVYELYQAGQIEQANELFNRLLPLVQFLTSEPDPAPLRWLLAERGHIRSDQARSSRGA
ncbi:dihydrodipicolinate synthase family protein [Paenibacillus sp. R14(2021)]|uniref:dihydrodipicolinate synthase family protein n=1 Tax=Paenibacillus sp. R14(2021) TaxID=2859228 RepID=UPI001C615AE3|nr:dihydrodipicolinate synthase family protein [Paenibacillus sp. R14(2021)]